VLFNDRDFAKTNTQARAGISAIGMGKMRDTLLKLYVRFQGLKSGEEGQDLVEYALVVCLIALAAITSVNQVASAVVTVFSNISSSLA
jgi:pilus assembly protein Flp/PilA